MQFQHYHNILTRLLFIFILGSSLFLKAQIVNIENLRHEQDSIGWSGHARLDFELEKNNTSKIFDFSNQLRLQYKGKKSLWFLIHDMEIKEVNTTEIKNNSTQHLRYSYELSPKISYEAFLQSQSDKVSEIKLRALVGTGLRFNLHQTKKYKFYLGTTLMYEHENSVDEIENVHNDIRTSTYFSFKIKANNNIALASSNYVQPLINDFSDFRILSETVVLFKIFKNLKFTTSFNYLFDAFPVKSVARVQYKLSNGLIYFFD